MATTLFFRKDGWVKSVIGPAVPGAQVYVCLQPANVTTLPASPLANIFSDPSGLVPITQPIITDGFGHYDYYVAAGLYTEVIGLNNTIQQVYPDQDFGLGQAGPDNPYTAGTNITIVGRVISATSSVSGLPAGGTTGQVLEKLSNTNFDADWRTPPALALKVNGSATTSQTVANFTNTPTISWTSDGVGGLFAAISALPASQAINNTRIWKAIANSGSLGDTIGFTANAISSTSGVIAATATDTCYVSWSTSATGGNQASVTLCGITGSGLSPNVFQIYTTQTLLAAKWRVLVPDTANTRVWVGLADVTSVLISNLQSDTPTGINFIGFRYSTAAGDTTWKAICNDGTQTVVDTLVPITTSGRTFSIAPSGSSIIFQIDNAIVATISTHVPANTVRMGDILSVDNIGLTNVKVVAMNLVATLEP